MGTEFGQVAEWDFAGELEWNCLDDAGHTGVQSLVRDLNRLYRTTPALYRRDGDPGGFHWLIVDADGSGSPDTPEAADEVFAWVRHGGPGDPRVVVVLNLTPVERSGYRLPFPAAGTWTEALNTDSAFYGGGDVGNRGTVTTEAVPCGGEKHSALVTLPPLSAIFFVEKPDSTPDSTPDITEETP
jgi:1,4-alpha-glucan branching enzyme